MSDDKKPLKGNTDKRHEPEGTPNRDRTPPGSIPPQSHSLGLGTKTTFFIEFTPENEAELDDKQSLSPEEERSQFLRDQIGKGTFVEATGDPDIDKKSVEDGDILITSEEREMLEQEQNQSVQVDTDPVSASDYAKAFAKAVANEQARVHNRDIERD